jgi:hypothetical protein
MASVQPYVEADMTRDPHDPWSEASTTPFWDLAVVLCTLAGGLGGGLAAVFAAGYFLTGQPSLAWPLVGTATVLLVVNVALRYGRSIARRRSW